ncbi:hypothetical protein KY49_6929 [Burkholderia sp. MSHR3999]|nr:hypothetical protein KY49_6929 [Burkholderia sp. MSHR3999]
MPVCIGQSHRNDHVRIVDHQPRPFDLPVSFGSPKTQSVEKLHYLLKWAT